VFVTSTGFKQHTLDEAFSRADALARLDRSIEKWRAQGCDLSWPEGFADLLERRRLIAEGAPFAVRDVAAEVVAEAGRAIGRGSFWRKTP
jgi:hypothetical protein